MASTNRRPGAATAALLPGRHVSARPSDHRLAGAHKASPNGDRPSRRLAARLAAAGFVVAAVAGTARAGLPRRRRATRTHRGITWTRRTRATRRSTATTPRGASLRTPRSHEACASRSVSFSKSRTGADARRPMNSSPRWRVRRATRDRRVVGQSAGTSVSAPGATTGAAPGATASGAASASIHRSTSAGWKGDESTSRSPS